MSRGVNRKFTKWEILVDGVTYVVEVRFLSEEGGANPIFKARCEELDASASSSNLDELYEAIKEKVIDTGSVTWQPHVLASIDSGGYGLRVLFEGWDVGTQRDGRVAYVARSLPQYFDDPTKVSTEDMVGSPLMRAGFTHVWYTDPSEDRMAYEPTRRRALLPYSAETIALCRRLKAIMDQAAQDLKDLLPCK